MDSHTSLAGLLTKHWYMPEWSVVGEGMSIVPPLMVSPLPLAKTSPLKYHSTVGAGVPATVQLRVTLSPTNWSRSSGECSSMTAASVGGERLVSGLGAGQPLVSSLTIHSEIGSADYRRIHIRNDRQFNSGSKASTIWKHNFFYFTIGAL